MSKQEHLISNLKALVQGYDKVVEILDAQIDAVVKNDLKRIENLAEEQIGNNIALESLELHLKESLQDIHNKDDGAELSLGIIIKEHFKGNTEIKDLRTSLLTRIADSQRLQHQLNSLLSFAREHIEKTLQRIYALNKETTTRYDQFGKKNTQDRSIFSRYA